MKRWIVVTYRNLMEDDEPLMHKRFYFKRNAYKYREGLLIMEPKFQHLVMRREDYAQM